MWHLAYMPHSPYLVYIWVLARLVAMVGWVKVVVKPLKSAGNPYRKAAGIACIFFGLKHTKIGGNSSSGFALEI